MSCWAVFVGKNRIKKEYIEDLENYMKGEFSGLKTQVFIDFIKEWSEDPRGCLMWKNAYKADWVGKYDTEVNKEEEVFTYSVSANTTNTFTITFWVDFNTKILEEITEGVIEQHTWQEDA